MCENVSYLKHFLKNHTDSTVALNLGNDDFHIFVDLLHAFQANALRELHLFQCFPSETQDTVDVKCHAFGFTSFNSWPNISYKCLNSLISQLYLP